jgi:hypothetical protein
VTGLNPDSLQLESEERAVADQEGTGQSNGFIVISNYKDVCKSPGAPIPYDIIAFLGHGAFTSGNTNFQGFPVFSMGSRVTQCFGDLPGVGLGIKSGSVGGWCRPITEVPTVICNGQKLCRHDHTFFEMNCLGPEGPGNTIGKVYYLGAMMCGPVAPGGKLGSQQNPPLQSSTPKELGALDKIKQSLSINSIEDAVALGKQAYALSQVDWSNPSAALGAIAGMAGRAGFKSLETGIGMVDKVKKLKETDWSNPVEALKAAASLGGDVLKLNKELDKDFGFDLLDVAGKLWTLPNTLLGLAIAAPGHVVQEIAHQIDPTKKDPKVTFGNNGIQFENNAFGIEGAALTLGNTIIYGPETPDMIAEKTQNGHPDEPYHGEHEAQHTHQSEVLGPFYLPAWLAGAGYAAATHPVNSVYDVFGPNNPMETGPYGSGPHGVGKHPKRPWPTL